MTSYKNIKRVAIENEKNDEYVSLVEYIIFENENPGLDNYAIFKFRNNLEQVLYEVGFTVYQYTIEKEIVEKSSINYKDFKCNNYDFFIPNKKFKINPLTKSLSVELKYALFEKIIFEDGITKPITYKYQDYLEDCKGLEKRLGFDIKVKKKEASTNPNNSSNRVVQFINKYQLKQQKRLKKSGVLIDDITDQNRSKAPIVSGLISLFIVTMLTIIFGLYIKNYSSIITKNGIKYKVDRETMSLEVVDFTSSNKFTVEIPERIGDFSVDSIGVSAFNGSKVKSVKSSANLVIAAGAFANCESLTTIELTGECVIETYSFVGSLNIVDFNAPYSTISQCTFTNSGSLSHLSFKSTDAISYKKIFFDELFDDNSLVIVSVSEEFYEEISADTFFKDANVLIKKN